MRPLPDLLIEKESDEMSLRNGEKARAALHKRARTNRRAKTAAARAGAAGGQKKPGGRPMAARAAKRQS
jgi:hypothetical protein